MLWILFVLGQLELTNLQKETIHKSVTKQEVKGALHSMQSGKPVKQDLSLAEIHEIMNEWRQRLLNVIKLPQSGKADCIVISLDREKTFSQVEWPYLFSTLEILGLEGVLGELELLKK